MNDASTVKWWWLNIFTYAGAIYLSHVTFNYDPTAMIASDLAILLLLTLIPFISVSLISNILATGLFQLSMIFARPDEPFANGPLLLSSFVVFFVSLFLSKRNLKKTRP